MVKSCCDECFDAPCNLQNISCVNGSRALGPTACCLRPHVGLVLSRQKLMMISHSFEFNTNTIVKIMIVVDICVRCLYNKTNKT